jgi:hypothetical protein
MIPHNTYESFKIYLNIQKIKNLEYADLYFIDDIVVVEKKAFTIVGKKEVLFVISAIEEEMGDTSNVHCICNTVDVFSIKPVEFSLIKSKVANFKSYSVITYGQLGFTNLVFERMFLKMDIARYDSLLDAVYAARNYSHIRNRGGVLT